MKIKTRTWLYFVFLILASRTNLPAQNYSYTQFNTDKGLAGSTVYKIVQDNDGFIWFATESGLSRFDGKAFRNFTTADGLPSNEVLNLYTDSKNRVWIISFSESLCYYHTGNIHHQQNTAFLKEMKLDEVVAIIEDNEGNIAFVSNYKSYIVTPEDKVITLKVGLIQQATNGSDTDLRY